MENETIKMEAIVEILVSIIAIVLGGCLADSTRWMKNASSLKKMVMILVGAVLLGLGVTCLMHLGGVI